MEAKSESGLKQLVYNSYSIVKLLTMRFPYNSIYLNFNRIDMKKELSSRKTNSTIQCKTVNDTKHSSKKQRLRKLQNRKPGHLMRRVKGKGEEKKVQMCIENKCEAESLETVIDTP